MSSWDELDRRYSGNASAAQDENDPWAALDSKYASPAPQPQQPVEPLCVRQAHAPVEFYRPHVAPRPRADSIAQSPARDNRVMAAKRG